MYYNFDRTKIKSLRFAICFQGKGTEDVNRYENCKLLFLDIANIHAMRDSIDKLQSVCEGAPEHKWLSQLEWTQWLTHISNVLRVSNALFAFAYFKHFILLLSRIHSLFPEILVEYGEICTQIRSYWRCGMVSHPPSIVPNSGKYSEISFLNLSHWMRFIHC